jgi:hypothetical protein
LLTFCVFGRIMYYRPDRLSMIDITGDRETEMQKWVERELIRKVASLTISEKDWYPAAKAKVAAGIWCPQTYFLEGAEEEDREYFMGEADGAWDEAVRMDKFHRKEQAFEQEVERHYFARVIQNAWRGSRKATTLRKAFLRHRRRPTRSSRRLLKRA